MQGHVSNGIGLRRGVGLNHYGNFQNALRQGIGILGQRQFLGTGSLIILGDGVAIANLTGNSRIDLLLGNGLFGCCVQGHFTELAVSVSIPDNNLDLIVFHFRSESLEGNCGCQQKHHQQQAEKLFANCFHFYSS